MVYLVKKPEIFKFAKMFLIILLFVEIYFSLEPLLYSIIIVVSNLNIWKHINLIDILKDSTFETWNFVSRYILTLKCLTKLLTVTRVAHKCTFLVTFRKINHWTETFTFRDLKSMWLKVVAKKNFFHDKTLYRFAFGENWATKW